MARIWRDWWPSRGIALATGEPSGVWVLDVDRVVGMASYDEYHAG